MYIYYECIRYMSEIGEIWKIRKFEELKHMMKEGELASENSQLKNECWERKKEHVSVE